MRSIRNIEDSVFLALVQADEEELKIARGFDDHGCNNVMSSRISASNVENAKKSGRRITVYEH